MHARLRQIHPALRLAARSRDGNVSLAAMAAETGISRFHLHRLFSAASGETPKQFTQRLRLDRAAGMLLAGAESILDVALNCGFQNHESFCRAFRKRFGMTPGDYRARGCGGMAIAQEHAACVDRVAPCLGFYRMEERDFGGANMSYSIAKMTLAPEPALVVHRSVKRSEVGVTIGEALQKVFLLAQKNGLALTGRPFMRCLEATPGMLTIEPGMRVVSQPESTLTGAGDVLWIMLPGGEAAHTVHSGKYDDLPEAYAAIEQWMRTEGLKAGGAPWEVYVTDPAENPDPATWRTEVYWPVASA